MKHVNKLILQINKPTNSTWYGAIGDIHFSKNIMTILTKKCIFGDNCFELKSDFSHSHNSETKKSFSIKKFQVAN